MEIQVATFVLQSLHEKENQLCLCVCVCGRVKIHDQTDREKREMEQSRSVRKRNTQKRKSVGEEGSGLSDWNPRGHLLPEFVEDTACPTP